MNFESEEETTPASVLSSLLEWSFPLDDQWTFARFSIRQQISTKASGLFVCHWKKCKKKKSYT